MHKHTSKNACTHTHTNGPTNVIISFSSCPLLLYPILFLCICLLSCIFHPVICHSILYLCHLSPILYLFILSSVILSYFFVTYILSYTFFILSSVIRSYFYVTHTLSYIFLILSSFCYRIVFLCHTYPIIKVSSASSHLSQCCICTLSLHLEPSSPNLKFLFLGVFELRESP